MIFSVAWPDTGQTRFFWCFLGGTWGSGLGFLVIFGEFGDVRSSYCSAYLGNWTAGKDSDFRELRCGHSIPSHQLLESLPLFINTLRFYWKLKLGGRDIVSVLVACFYHYDSLEVVCARKAVSATSSQPSRSSWSKPDPCCWSRYIHMPWNPADAAEGADAFKAV